MIKRRRGRSGMIILPRCRSIGSSTTLSPSVRFSRCGSSVCALGHGRPCHPPILPHTALPSPLPPPPDIIPHVQVKVHAKLVRAEQQGMPIPEVAVVAGGVVVVVGTEGAVHRSHPEDHLPADRRSLPPLRTLVSRSRWKPVWLSRGLMEECDVIRVVTGFMVGSRFGSLEVSCTSRVVCSCKRALIFS
jgi:hypothetical protein